MPKDKKTSIRIEDVAQHAGVSMKSVSRVLNNEPNVRPAMREKVMLAVKELDYRPNISARSLAGNKSYLIGLLYGPVAPAYLMSIQTGALNVCISDHYGLVLHPCDLDNEKLADEIDLFLRQSGLDGLILTPPISDNPVILKVIHDMDIPFVRISPLDPENGASVSIDDAAAATELMTHLIDLGHKDIGIIKGPDAHGASAWRYESYKTALEEMGLAVDDDLVAQGNFTYESGRRAANQLLDQSPKMTALFACNDDMAIGAIHAIQDRSLSVPEDIAVVGFDDAPVASQTRPPLTTIHQPMRQLGAKAARCLVNMIQGEAGDLQQKLQYELKIRKSTVGS